MKWFARHFPALAELDWAGWIIGTLALIVGVSCIMAFIAGGSGDCPQTEMCLL